MCLSLPFCLWAIWLLIALYRKLDSRPMSSALSCILIFFYFVPLALCRRTQAEMAHTCRGTINLATAHIDTEDACNIVLSSGGRTYHLKASTEVERQRWVTALELAKAKAIRMMNDQSGKSSWSKKRPIWRIKAAAACFVLFKCMLEKRATPTWHCCKNEWWEFNLDKWRLGHCNLCQT